MTYVSEGLRAAPDAGRAAHPPWICLVLPGGAVILLVVGSRGFYRRAVD